jgi:hypothetical protein
MIQCQTIIPYDYIYIYPGTIDSISLKDIDDDEDVVIVHNNLEMIYSLKHYNLALDYMISEYGLIGGYVIDPRKPTPYSATSIHNIRYYKTKLITKDITVPMGSPIAGFNG